MLMRLLSGLTILGLSIGLWAAEQSPATKPALKILFIGDKGHHNPADRHRTLAPIMAKAGIDLVYTDSLENLNAKTLEKYDGIAVYANHPKISSEQEQALLDFVEKDGKPLICLHCGSYCFLNSEKYIALVGAQFKSHKTGTFRTEVANAGHPIMKGFTPFESWDETYVHHKHNDKDRTILEYRQEGKNKEPWTWTRTQGKGKVFYTAWGHDDRTFSNPGFQQLVARGIYWATGRDPSSVPASVPASDTSAAPAKEEGKPRMTALRKDVKPFEYATAKVAYYPPEKRGNGQPLDKMQKPLEPAESMKHMVHPDDFEVKVFVTEEKLGGKPICMNWDERGRLWVAVTYDYPNELQPAGEGRDRIVVCEDTTGSGVADKVTTFADKLSIPTSIIFHNGGIIVHQAPNTLFLKDSKGTGTADVREVLFSGWGTRDTHAGPSNLHYGLDNWIYGMVGYSGFNGSVGKESFKFSQGFYRFKPATMQFEFLRSTNNNSWGIGLSEEGVLFGSTANGNPSVYMPIANRYYEKVKGWSSSVLAGIAGSPPIYPITDKVRQVDWHGQHTAAAGHALYTARQYPSYYWNKVAFVTEPTGHVVSTFQIKANGADYSSKNSWNLLASDDEWTAPIMAEVGPDGNVWVIDWYNFIVQHNPTPVGWKTGKGGAYESELRDKKHGRIYRLVPKKTAATKTINLKDAQPETLVATLRHSNKFWRDHAQRLLVERGQKDVVPALLKMLGEPKPDEIGIDAGPMHAIWTLEGLKALDEPGVREAIEAAGSYKAVGVRRAVAQMAPHYKLAGLVTLQDKKLLEDDDAQVRLAAMLSLSELPPNQGSGQAIVQFLQSHANAGDKWLKDAAIAAAAANGQYFVAALFEEAAAKPINFPAQDILSIVTEHMARSGKANAILEALTPLDKQIDGKANPKLTELMTTYFTGAIRGWTAKENVVLDDNQIKTMKSLYGKVGFRNRAQLLQVATLCHSAIFEKEATAIAESGLKQASDEKATDDQRIEAIVQLIQLRGSDKANAEKMLALVTPRTSPSVALAVVENLLEASTSVTDGIVKQYPGWSPALKSAALRVMLSKKEQTTLLLAALENKQVSISDLSLAQKQALSSHPDKKISDRAKKLLAAGGSMPSADRQKVINELLFTTEKTGDAKAGKLMFVKHCAVCHRHNGEGNVVGPDLTGMSVHPKKELIVHIMDPSRDVEGNYRMYTVRTTSGTVLNGLLASETRTSVEILDAQAKKQTILREDIEEIAASTKSLMPEGFEKQMTPEEFTNLLEFMTEKGKYVPLPLDRIATANSMKGMFFGDEGKAERLTFPDWKPKTFEGIPFVLVDPTDGKKNVVLLNSPNSERVAAMPKSVTLACNTPAKAIHILGGIGGWAFPGGIKGSESMIVRLHYKDDKKPEDHILRNGEEMADYIRVVDVAKSKLAFKVPSQQVRYLAITPGKPEMIESIELVKGKDMTAPIVVAVTIETP